MYQLISASPEIIRQVGSWIKTAGDCLLWAGPRLRFPFNAEDLPDLIGGDRVESYALRDDVTCVGFGQLVYKDKRRGHLARIIVSPERRGKGFGTILLEYLLKRCREEGYQRVSLNVVKTNEIAIKLYESLGFTRSRRPSGDTDSPESLYMELALD